MNSLVIIVCLIGPLFAFHANNLLRRHGPPIKFERSSRSTKVPEFHWILQRVDNFNPYDSRGWYMRYLSNDQFFQYGGPIFIYLGGEWTIEDSPLRGGQMFEMAYQHSGYMFYTEHRYYGYSHPTENIENRKYLTTEQALADIVNFVLHVKSTIRGLSYSKVVVVGASYSANMATWIRLKYPNVIDAAYASSGPVKAVANFDGYLEVVGNDIGLVSQECKRTVSDAFAQLEKKLETANGVYEMSMAFGHCTRPQNVEPGRSMFFTMVISIFADAAQYEGLEGLFRLCNQFLLSPGTALEKLIGIYKMFNKYNCTDAHREYINPYFDDKAANTRSWYYQTCTEYGYYATTTSDKQPFGHTITLESWVQQCAEFIGKNFGLETLQYNVNQTNAIYGGLTPNVTKVLSVHGSADPWHRLGILKDLNYLAPAIFINGTTHCQDLRTENVNDPPPLVEARKKAQAIIAEWIK